MRRTISNHSVIINFMPVFHLLILHEQYMNLLCPMKVKKQHFSDIQNSAHQLCNGVLVTLSTEVQPFLTPIVTQSLKAFKFLCIIFVFFSKILRLLLQILMFDVSVILDKGWCLLKLYLYQFQFGRNFSLNPPTENIYIIHHLYKTHSS